MSADSDGTPQLLLENQICFPLYSAANAVVRAYRPLLQELDLTYLQYIVLMVLWEEKELNVGELGNRLGLDSGTLTPLLKRLEGKGLVERRRSKEDERARTITLTRRGSALKSRARDIPGKVAGRVGWSTAREQEMKRLCKELLAVLEE